jgi:hypothetical protein
VTSPEIWREFANDPRSPAYASMRAADADRDVVLRALGEAYAEGRLDAAEFDERSSAVQKARTLGELPAFLADLVPPPNVAPHPPTALSSMRPLTPERVEAEAVARWEKSRREAFTMWVFVSVVCWVIYLATSFPGHPWPVYPMVGTSLPVLGTLIQRKDMIASNRRKIIAKHQKALAKDAKRRALEQQRREQIEPRPPGQAET